MRRVKSWKHAERAFSMVELLVVITILAALAAGGTIWFRVAERAKMKTLTDARLQAIGAALDSLKLDLGYYPAGTTELLRAPDRTPIGQKIGKPNETNQGIEAVYVAFHMAGVTVNTDGLGDQAIANTDEDAAMDISGTTLTVDQLFEYVDAWGNPFVYIHGADYKDVSKVEKYMLANGEEVIVQPRQSEKTGAFVRAQSYQLFSMGPDKTPGTSDDIHWGTE